jgi:hypothetical protein
MTAGIPKRAVEVEPGEHVGLGGPAQEQQLDRQGKCEPTRREWLCPHAMFSACSSGLHVIDAKPRVALIWIKVTRRPKANAAPAVTLFEDPLGFVTAEAPGWRHLLLRLLMQPLAVA